MLGSQPRSVCLKRLSVGGKHALHFVQNLEIPKSTARNFDKYRICMKYQRRWYKICACGLCGKLCKIEVKRLIFCFLGGAYDVVFLFWRCVSQFNVNFSLEKVSNLSDIAFLSIAVKHIVSLATLDNSKIFLPTSHPVVSAAGESSANFTLVPNETCSF